MDHQSPDLQRFPNLAVECGDGATSIHIRRARDGMPASVAWLVSRFTPYLRVQARRRLAHFVAQACDEDDVVQEVWLRVLPRLGDLRPRNGKWTPVLLRYLGTTLLHLANDLYRRQLRRRPAGPGSAPEPGTPVEDLSADITDALTHALHLEAAEAVMSALSALSEQERDTFTMRAMEGLSNQEVAARFQEPKQTASMRYARTLEKLRAAVPEGLLDDLDAG